MRRLVPVYLFLVILLTSLITACTPSSNDTPQQSDIEATVVANVEATLLANAVSIEEKVQATVTAILGATQTAVALLPTSTPTSAATATPTTVPTVVTLATPTPPSTDTPVAETSPTETPQPTPTETVAPTSYRVPTNANLRSGPGTNYSVVTTLQAGESVRLLARTEDSGWFQVATEKGDEAWIAAFLIELPAEGVDVPLALSIPEAPTPAPTPQSQTAIAQTPAQSSGQRLDVTFINPHYNCDRGNDNVRIRYFQADMFITNTSGETIVAPWKPTRWLIANGDQSRESTEMRQWCDRKTGCYPQPDLLPGGSEGWTWITGRVEMAEWVQAVEWEYNGQTYRQEFENNAFNRAEWNYRACQ